MNSEIIEKAKAWQNPPFDSNTITEVTNLIENNPTELAECFYKDLDFGTGGLRGIMGAGTNRLNIYTISMATQGLCNYLKQQFTNEEISIAIAYDSRNNSPLFCQTAANVCAANGIKAYVFDDLRPTPELSFAVRYLGCKSGIVITASHNPPEYNGYKVYWEDGGQIVPPHDKGIITEVRKVTSYNEVKQNIDQSLIVTIGNEVDEAYLQEVKKLSSTFANKDLKIVYTNLHGTGIKLIPQALKNVGFNDLHSVKEQEEPDGNFPTVASPNPEESAALALAVEKAKETNADILFGTDPDTDRVGLAYKNADGEFVLMNGNEAASLLIYSLINQWKSDNKDLSQGFVAKTIVTTGLIDDICNHYNVECVDTLTGFKYIAEQIRLKEGSKTFIGGGEESYGYLIGDFVRDKDAVASTVMLAEMAQTAKYNGKTLDTLLKEIHLQFGAYKEGLVSITKKGMNGAQEIADMMDNFRNNPPKELGGISVSKVADYKLDTFTDLNSGQTNKTGLPSSNVLQFFLEDGSKVTARPSGTEPKIKFYFSVKSMIANDSEYEAVITGLTDKIENIKSSLGI